LPFDLAAEKIGTALQISSVTENVAEQGMNVVFTEVTNLVAGQPYLLLPSKDLENPIFEGVTIVNTSGETTDPVVGAGIKITFTGIINGVGETTGSTDYYVGDKGYLYNGTTEKLGLRAFFTIIDEAGNPTARTKKILEATPMKRFGEADELIGTLLFLADDNASGFLTGTVIPVDGGFSAYSGV
jgi:hypothetical protein